MDTLKESETRAERMRRFIEVYGIPEDEVEFYLDLADGKHKGDIVGLTDEERRRMGLDHSALDDVYGDGDAPTPRAIDAAPAADRTPGS